MTYMPWEASFYDNARVDRREREMSSSKKLTPVKCGLKFKPPMLVLLYNDLDTGKTRKRSMPLRGFSSDTNIAVYLADLLQNPKHSKYLNTIPREQLDKLLHLVKDAHGGVVPSSPMVAVSSSMAPASSPLKPPSLHQSSLLDIPPILTSSPNHTHLTKKEFDDELEELINFDDDIKDGNKLNLSSDSLDKLLESPEHAGEKKEAIASRQLFSKENDKQAATKLSDLPGLSANLGMSPKLDTAVESAVDNDPLLSVLNGSSKRLFGIPPLNSTKKNSGLGELPPIGGAPGGAKKTGGVQNSSYATEPKAENLQLSERKPSNILSIPKEQSSDILFSTEVPNYPEDFDDESLAVEELLDDGDDGSLGLGLGDKLYAGARLSGSSSGDDLKRLDEIVTPPPEAGRTPPLYPAKTSVHDDDLNKATDEYLEKKKEEMNALFESNRLKPGDEGYVYDKEVDFDVGPKMESGWDSDDSMSDF